MEVFPRHTAQSCHQPDVLVPLPSSHHLNCHCCLILFLLTLCLHCILSPTAYGPGSHPPNEERPSSWSLLQLWQTRPHCKGLLKTTHPECLEHQHHNNSKTHSQGLADPHGIH